MLNLYPRGPNSLPLSLAGHHVRLIVTLSAPSCIRGQMSHVTCVTRDPGIIIDRRLVLSPVSRSNHLCGSHQNTSTGTKYNQETARLRSDLTRARHRLTKGFIQFPQSQTKLLASIFIRVSWDVWKICNDNLSRNQEIFLNKNRFYCNKEKY